MPQQNGLAERKHRHITELGLSMMFESKMMLNYWMEAFFTAAFLSNLLPTSTLPNHQTPHQKLFDTLLNYTFLRTFGCACYPSLRDYGVNKFDHRLLRYVFPGYNNKYKGYKCLYPPTGRVYIPRHVLFDETDFPFADTYKQSHPLVLTPLLKAWQMSFLPQDKSSTNEEVSIPKDTQVLHQAVSPLFTEAYFPPLTTSNPNHTGSPKVSSPSLAPVPEPIQQK